MKARAVQVVRGVGTHGAQQSGGLPRAGHVVGGSGALLGGRDPRGLRRFSARRASRQLAFEAHEPARTWRVPLASATHYWSPSKSAQFDPKHVLRL